MPNPFIERVGAPNRSHREMTDREPIEPIVEQYEGTNLPYRGVQYHGVEPTERPQEPEGYANAVEVDYLDAEPTQEAVPVRVVNRTDRYQRTARADTFTLVANIPVNVAGREDTRTSLKIVNTHATQTVYIGFAANMTNWNGSYPLAAGKDITTVSQDDVFVMSLVGGELIGWIAEYELPVDDN